jgi:hypothetical protein
MKLICCILDELLRLKIKFHKSKVFCFGTAKYVEGDYTTLFGCEAGYLSFTYLEIPIHHRRLRNSE